MKKKVDLLSESQQQIKVKIEQKNKLKLIEKKGENNRIIMKST